MVGVAVLTERLSDFGFSLSWRNCSTSFKCAEYTKGTGNPGVSPKIIGNGKELSTFSPKQRSKPTDVFTGYPIPCLAILRLSRNFSNICKAIGIKAKNSWKEARTEPRSLNTCCSFSYFLIFPHFLLKKSGASYWRDLSSNSKCLFPTFQHTLARWAARHAASGAAGFLARRSKLGALLAASSDGCSQAESSRVKQSPPIESNWDNFWSNFRSIWPPWKDFSSFAAHKRHKHTWSCRIP